MTSSRTILALFVVMAAAITLGVALLAGRAPQTDLPDYFSAPRFSLVDQDQRAFDSDELQGKVWVVDFIYTNCPDVCPLVTANLARVRGTLPEGHRLGTDVRFVSITVDPARDSASALRAFAHSFGVQSPQSWVFLTGSEAALRATLAAFHVVATPAPHRASDSLERGKTGATEQLITHSSQLMLVDRHGRVRGLYAGTRRPDVDRLARDLRSLL